MGGLPDVGAGCADISDAEFMEISSQFLLENVPMDVYFRNHGVSGCKNMWKVMGNSDPSTAWGIKEGYEKKEDFTQLVCFGSFLPSLASVYCKTACGISPCGGACQPPSPKLTRDEPASAMETSAN